MIKGKSQPLSWILKIPIYHHQVLNCKINVEYNMLSMVLSRDGRQLRMTATWLAARAKRKITDWTSASKQLFVQLIIDKGSAFYSSCILQHQGKKKKNHSYSKTAIVNKRRLLHFCKLNYLFYGMLFCSTTFEVCTWNEGEKCHKYVLIICPLWNILIYLRFLHFFFFFSSLLT